jgi:Cu-processing system ATP-binding protein
VIRFDRFSKSFGAERAVDSLELSIRSGDVLALLGPNGSGKTTCLKAVAGLLKPSSGTVWIGDPERLASDPGARSVLSYLPQRVSFPEALSGREVVEFYRRLRGAAPDRVATVLRFASLNGASARAVSTYSGGMVQRLGLAVAALPDAPVLLLDEPTAALDPAGLSAFYELIDERKRGGKTVFFSSHQLGDVERVADRFAILVGGRLVALLARDELMRRLAERGVLRLRLSRMDPALLARVRAISTDASWSGQELVVAGPSSIGPRVLDLVRESGLEIQSLTAEEGRLDGLYRDLVAATTENDER